MLKHSIQKWTFEILSILEKAERENKWLETHEIVKRLSPYDMGTSAELFYGDVSGLLYLLHEAKLVKIARGGRDFTEWTLSQTGKDIGRFLVLTDEPFSEDDFAEYMGTNRYNARHILNKLEGLSIVKLIEERPRKGKAMTRIYLKAERPK